MRLVADKCPECGARVEVDADRAEARCEYCGASFRVGARAPVAGPAPEAAAAPADLRPRGRGRLVLAVVVVALVAAGTFVALRRPEPPTGQPAAAVTPEAPLAAGQPAAAPEDDGPQWLPPQQAILADVNGDGLADPIGWARYYRRPGTPQHLVALDAASGRRFWQSDEFPDENWSVIRVALVGDRLVVADAAGLLRAIAVDSGRTVWSAPLGERVRRICRRTEDGVLLHLEDGRALEVRLATGALTPRGQADRSGADCETLWTPKPGDAPQVRVDAPPFSYGRRIAIDGLRTAHVLQAEGSRLAFALGSRAPGTALPMVAAFDPGERDAAAGPEDTPYTAVWRTALASLTPLGAVEGAPQLAWFDAGRLFVPYATTGAEPAQRLACLDAASGRSILDVVLANIEPTRAMGIAGANGRLYVSHSRGLEAYDARTGDHLLHLSD